MQRKHTKFAGKNNEVYRASDSIFQQEDQIPQEPGSILQGKWAKFAGTVDQIHRETELNSRKNWTKLIHTGKQNSIQEKTGQIISQGN